MTGEHHEVQDIRLFINNMKRAEYRANWKKEDRKKKKTQTINETKMAKGMSLICIFKDLKFMSNSENFFCR